MKLVAYVAGPYTADTPEGIAANIAAADAVGRRLLELGYVPIIPHNNTAGWEADERFRYDDFLRADLEILARCDAIVLLPGWQASEGARWEWKHATARGLEIIRAEDLD